MTKLFYRSERDVTVEIDGKTRYIKVTITDYGSNSTVFYLDEDFIEELAHEVDRAKGIRINNQRNL